MFRISTPMMLILIIGLLILAGELLWSIACDEGWIRFPAGNRPVWVGW